MSEGDQKAFKKSIRKDTEEIISNFPNKKNYERKEFKQNTSYVEDLTTDDNDQYQKPLPKIPKHNQQELIKNSEQIKHLKERDHIQQESQSSKTVQKQNKNDQYFKRFGISVNYNAEEPLKLTNSHQRDNRIIFLEEPHEYQIKLDNGKVDTNYLSVTQFIKTFLFPQFDEDEAIDNIMKSVNWQQSKYYGMSPDDIKHLWESVRNQSSQAGQQLHKSISQFYDGIDDGNSTQEFSQFIEFHRKVIEDNGLVPFRAEWPIYNEDIKIAGSIDMLYQLSKDDSSKLVLYDWKRTIKLQGYNKFSNGFWPVEHLPNSNFWQYSLQLNLYKDILQSKYDKQIVGMFLITLHPENLFLKSKVFIVPDLSKEIEDIKELRLSQLECLEKGQNIFK